MVKPKPPAPPDPLLTRLREKRSKAQAKLECWTQRMIRAVNAMVKARVAVKNADKALSRRELELGLNLAPKEEK